MTQPIAPIAEVKCGRLRWRIPDPTYSVPDRFLNNDTHPLYDQGALDAAVAAERERCARLCDDYVVVMGRGLRGDVLRGKP